MVNLILKMERRKNMHQYWEKLKSQPKPDIDKISFFTLKVIYGLYLATKDSENKLGLRIQFEEISKEILKDKNFPEWDEIDINVPDLSDPKEIYLDIRLRDSLFEKQFNYLAEDILSEADNVKQKYHFWSLFMENVANGKTF